MGTFPRRVGLVLGGGGLKGFAHIGVLRALEEMHIRPALYAGTSIGALISAAHAAGMSIAEMTRRAEALRQRDLFRINHMGMLLERMRAPSIYLEQPLRALCEGVCGPGRFDDLPVPVLVNTVDVQDGTQVVWGTPGLRDVRVSDAVYASCALPGFFPPGDVDGRPCIDGGTIDNLPVSIAALDVDALIAVDVGSTDLDHRTNAAWDGFASIYMRAATVMMHALQQIPLTAWSGPPMVLIRPRVGQVSWFSFTHTPELIREGYRAAKEALAHLDACLDAPGGVYPRRAVRVEVDRAKCTGCGLCVALAPRLMSFDAQRKAYAVADTVHWSPADGDFVHHCPVNAITARRLDSIATAQLQASEEPEAA